MRRLIAFFILAATALARPAGAADAADTAEAATTLRALLDREWNRAQQDSPEWATTNGDHRFDDRWTDWSPEAIATREAADRTALQQARAIDRRALPPGLQADYDVFVWQMQTNVERQRFREWLEPIDHRRGVQAADDIVETARFESAADYEAYLRRLAALPVLVAQTVALMRQGLAAGQVPPRVLMERVSAQIARQMVADAAQSPFYRPLQRLPEAVPAAQAQALQARAQALIREQVVPAYRSLQAFFDGEYLPRTRRSTAIADRPDGRAYYDFLARYYTTADLTAERIHAIGLAEVARLEQAMERVKAEAGFHGTMAEFFNFLRTEPRFFRRTPAELLDTYRAVAKRIDPELVKVVRTLPRQPYGVRPIPDNVAPDTTAAYYQFGALDGSRAGYFYVNLYKPESRPTWEMLPLALHEAVPGHHLQFALQAEITDASPFRRTAYFVAYSEGWALYAEQLGLEMGLYDDPYDRFGQLTYEMWRAVRLVVDTGLHLKGWSREQAIDYFRAHTAKTDTDILNEVDRYIGTPAQALAYKIGQMQISALRAEAAQALGAHFDLREFHDVVLAEGAMPLSALQARVRAWIAARR